MMLVGNTNNFAFRFRRTKEEEEGTTGNPKIPRIREYPDGTRAHTMTTTPHHHHNCPS